MSGLKISAVLLSLLLVTAIAASAAGIKGEFKLSYTYEDETGNEAVERSSFNEYEGLGVSLENMIWNFDNGHRIDADFRNITLNNRNLRLGVQKNGMYRLNLFNNQYRRVYNSEGSNFTRRHNTGGNFWFNAHKYLRLYGGISNYGRTGSRIGVFDDFNDFAAVVPEQIDYGQTDYHFGMTFRHKARMLQAEYRGADFKDNNDAARDQKRQSIKLWGFVPVPEYEWIRAYGGYRHFITRYDESDFEISANTVWGGLQADLPYNFVFSYYGLLDRTQSDSELVANDNMVHTAYIAYTYQRKAGLTVGYQFDSEDDVANEIEGRTVYIYGWLKPVKNLDIRGEFGSRAEEVFTGTRLWGDQDAIKHRFSVKYNFSTTDYIRGKMLLRSRENKGLGTEVDYSRGSLDGYYRLLPCADLSVGYNYTDGDYANLTQNFEFIDHLVYGDLILTEPLKLKGTKFSFGGMYYRSKRDIDIERITLRFGAEYLLFRDYYLEANYDVHNYDDFTVAGQYYTANVVTISLNKRFNY